eukprot:413686_1
MSEEKQTSMNESIKMIHEMHQHQLKSGIRNNEYEHEIVEILGGIDEILTIFFQFDLNGIITKQQIDNIYEIIGNSNTQQQPQKTTKLSVDINNIEDKGMNQNIRYNFHDKDTFLFSLLNSNNYAFTILKVIENKIVILFLVMIMFIAVIVFMISGFGHGLSLNALSINVYWIYVSIAFIIYFIYIILWLLYTNKLAMKLIITQFEFHFKNFYLIQFLLANIGMTHLGIYNRLWYVEYTYYLLLIVFLFWVMSFDAVNIKRENKLIISCYAAALFSISALEDLRKSFFRDQYTLYTTATLKISIWKSTHIKMSLIDISYQSAMILSIFMFRQILLLIMYPNKCLMIRKKPIVKYENIDDNIVSDAKKYALSFQEIILVNNDLIKLLDEQVIKNDSTDNKEIDCLLTEAKKTREEFEKHPIWPWIDLIPKRKETIEISSNQLTNDGHCEILCNFSVDTAVISSQALPIFDLKWRGRAQYYEMTIKNIGPEVTTNLSIGFSHSNENHTITSTTIPGKHRNTFGIEGDKGQLMVSNSEQISYLETPFESNQCIGAAIKMEAVKENDRYQKPKRSYITYKFMHSESTGCALKEYPETPASLLPIDEIHEFHAFLSVGSKATAIEINFGPIFKDEDMTRKIKEEVLSFPRGKAWIDDWANSAERRTLINNILKDYPLDSEQNEKEEKECKEIKEMRSDMQDIIKIDVERLKELLLRIQVAKEQLSKDSFDDDITDKDEEMISCSLYLLAILHYSMFLNPIKEMKKNEWKKINFVMGLHHCGKIGFKFAENKLLDKILKICKKLKRKANIKLFNLIKKYGNKLKKIDKNMDENGIRLKHPSNYSAEDAPRPLLYLGKLSISSKISEKYLLSLWKMVSRDRLLNAKETSLEALKQEFLLDFISCFLSQQSKLQ